MLTSSSDFDKEFFNNVNGFEGKIIDVLYAFTDCEVSISPNSGIIEDDKPKFIGVSKILKQATENTQHLLTRELEIRLGELNESWHFNTLEKIFERLGISTDKKLCEQMIE